MKQNLFEDWFKKIEPPKEIFVDKPTTEFKRSETTEFSNEMPQGMYQVSFQYDTSADATVEKNSQQLESFTKTWRLVTNYPEVGDAIEEIVNEAIITDTDDDAVKLDLSQIEDTEITEKIKEKMTEQFKYILELLSFDQNAQDIFEWWYTDGRLDYEVVEHKTRKNLGIVKLNRLDPLNIKKILEKSDYREFGKPKEEGKTYWIYTDPKSQTRWQVSPDLVVHIGSGKTDKVTGLEVSYLHKALKAINNMRLIEDAIVIYRIVRAPERRVFSIDTGNLPKPKAEEYIRGLIQKFQNNIVYDTVTGTITNKKNVMAMVEDFYLGKSANGQGSSISSISGGQNLGQLDDLYYFVNKVWHALKVPETRRQIKEKALFDTGRTTQLERDEVKFNKFISKLRKQFSTLFTELLYRQLILTNVLSKEKMDKIKKKIRYIYTNENFYKEIKETEMLTMRLDMVSRMKDYVGEFYTQDDIALKVLKFTEEEWKEKQKLCKEYREQKAKEEVEKSGPYPTGDETGGTGEVGKPKFPPKKEEKPPVEENE